MDYFASDFHLGHNKDFIFKNRGFSSCEDHDKVCLSELSKLTSKDTLYYLGDYSFHNCIIDILDTIIFTCKVVFITGNHDKLILKNRKYFPERWVFSGPLFDYKNKDINITLCHYPMRVWNKSHFDSWHLYGHLHQKTDFGGKTLNVTIDNTDKFLLSLDEVVEFMKNREHNYDYINKE